MSESTEEVRVRLLPCGDAAVLVELDDLETVLRMSAAIASLRQAGGLEQVVDVVPAARTVLLRCRGGGDLAALARDVRRLPLPDDVPSGPGGSGGLAGVVRIPVVYDGADLDEVSRLTGLGRAEVVARHQDTEWTVAFTGFAPGFGYLVGGDGSLAVPRRGEPRARVPAGAVGLAGEFTGVYPRASPGGWQLIGRTEVATWDVARRPVALLRPGVRVRFEAARP